MNPDKIAIRSECSIITYCELEGRSNQVANFLRKRVQYSSPHVMIILERSPELIISILGILKSGLVFVPVTPSFPVNRVKQLIEEIHTQWVITDGTYYLHFKDIIQNHVNQKIGNGLKTVIIDRIDEVIEEHENIFYLDFANESGTIEFERAANQNCYIYFTSGSTGTPKGVLGKQSSLIHFIEWEIKEFGIDKHFNVSQLTPPSFDPFLRDIFVPLIAGGVSCIPSSSTLMNIQKLIHWIDKNNITLIHTVPSLFKSVCVQINNSDYFQHLKYILLAGELLRGRDVEGFINIFNGRIQLVNIYGPTETTLAKLFYRIDSKDVNRAIIPVGKPIANTQVLILDKNKEKCAQGKKGEIYIRTPFISSGYYNDPILTKELFIKNPYSPYPNDIIYKSGDLGRLLPDGNIELSGRVDFQVKIRGIRIEIGEIENKLLAHQNIIEAVAMAKEDENHDKHLWAYIVPEQGKKIPVTALRDYLSKELPSYMIPAYFVFLENIPLATNGKVDRAKLLEYKLAEVDQGLTYDPPVNLTEEKIANIWEDLLKLDKVGVNNNFFDLGGNSLKIMEMNIQLSKEFNTEIPMAKLFEHPTVRSVAKYLQETKDNKIQDKKSQNNEIQKRSGEIAVIGMACRFPGANNIEEFWNNLKAGKETISFFSDDQLAAAGVPRELIDNPNYVKVGSIINDKEFFDAAFFEYTPKEAELLDPQIRLFHECSWEALEDSGIALESYKGLIGVYAGSVQNLEWEIRALLSGKSSSFGSFAASRLTGIRYLCTRLSYNMNLKGPSITMQTACSTSLVAVHMGCQALFNGECDVAIAGGVSVAPEGKWGYLYEENMIYSPDGHCRSFDAKAGGTIFGEGVGIVILKPLEAALADGNNIHAVIKGSAINNDGNRKIGFTAPSIPGQVEVIQKAMQIANIEPTSVTYIETHGTATPMGDPIEIESLKQVFGTEKKKYCKIGSVKSNFGHLDAAAGIAGFIKTVLSLKFRQIPPSLHFEIPNPAINFVDSPFEVNTRLVEWKNEGSALRAGVTSLGMGGTNAHIILEEAPQREKSSESRNYQILLLSAKNENSLDMMAHNLADFLKNNPKINLADIAYTLQTGRKKFNQRRTFTCSGIDDAIEKLSASNQESHSAHIVSNEESPTIVFMFSGQGSQYVNMGLELYRKEPVFQEEIDHCFSILNPLIGLDLKEILYPNLDMSVPGKQNQEEKNLHNTEITQPIIFAFEYALAKLLINWGIKPEAMIGHSIGEYTAACLSGVLSLEDTLKLVVLRGKLMQKMPAGAMLSIPLSVDDLKPLLIEELDIAAINSSALCVVSGEQQAIEKFEKKLNDYGRESKKLITSCAFHSRLMNPILLEFEEEVRKYHFNKPQIPCISNLSGVWIQDEELNDPHYWSRHLREAVYFTKGLETLFGFENAIYIEVGPGNTLSKFANLHTKKNSNHIVMNLIRHPHENVPDDYYLLNRIGQLWIYNQAINWDSFYAREKRFRISLPAYPFDRKYYWLEKIDYNSYKNNKTGAERKKNLADWFYIPSWKRTVLSPGIKDGPNDNWNLVFMDSCGLGYELLAKYRTDLEKTVRIFIGKSYVENPDSSFIINPGSDEDYEKLFAALFDSHRIPGLIVHMWNVTGSMKEPLSIQSTHKAQDIGFYSLINIAKALGNIFTDNRVEIITITDNLHDVMGNGFIEPAKSTILGPINVIPQEYNNIKCRSIDIVLPVNNVKESNILLSSLFDELAHESPDKIIAYRDGRRWVHILEPVKLPPAIGVPNLLIPRSVYLITGGLGGIGLVLAEYLSKTVKPKLVITGRSNFPGKEEWHTWLLQHDPQNQISEKIKKLQSIEENGSQVLYIQADVSNLEEMENKLHTVEKELGEIKGILHIAGAADFAGVIHKRTRGINEEIFASKLNGTLVLDHIFRDRKLNFFILFSSMSSLCAHFGQVGYSSANAFIDAYATYRKQEGDTFVKSINWDTWSDVGMAVNLSKNRNENRTIKEGISNEEGIDAFIRIITHHFPNIAVSTIDFQERLATHQLNEKFEAGSSQSESYNPPSNKIEVSAFTFNSINEVEKQMAEIWRELLGHEQIRSKENFFELGGDSLTAIKMRKRINEVFNIDIPLVKIYHLPTIELLVRNFFEKDKADMNQVQQEEKEDAAEDLSEIFGKFEEI